MEHVYEILEVAGSSKKSIEDAVKNAVAAAGQKSKNLRWFEVVETRGYIEEGKISYWQVAVKIGATVEA
ncbi:MAG TPA: dodecin family protein [Syntrophales bacterium]|nr:dodecin family protein [Syntrophales bacterium]HQB29655.1 dodecin family protein [Syntrophales bacterium]HQN78174.1 dodecin family protein [Syntrophales bacterium]HQQ27723.1 dodecin family protein [Syntrophales bacterium]